MTANPQSGYQMTPAFQLTLMWVVGCMLAFVTAMNFLPAALVDGHYIPAGNDSFYHARRILDTVAHPNAFYEFDRYIHYPDGSWLTWPWGYDYLMAQIVRLSLWLFGEREPMAVLAYLPVFAMPITMALVLGIATVLRLSIAMRWFIVLVFGISPLTQTLHAVGMVDHHFAEHICILLAILLGMLWWRQPVNRVRATALGVVLGMSVAIHNGLFIIQLPVLGVLFLTWLRREPLDWRATTYFAGTLFLTTLLVSLPAEALRRGEFAFYLLSWFHVYVAGCTALVSALLARWPFSRKQLVVVGGTALVLVVPLIAQVIVGGEFVSGRMGVLKGVDEVQSPVALAFSLKGAARISELYGLLVWLTPLFIAVSVFQLWREPRPEYRYFWLVSIFTLTLMMFQLRFFYFGSLALYVIPFWCLDQLRNMKPQWARLAVPAAAIVTAAAIAAPMKSILFDQPAPGLDPEYAVSRSLYPPLAAACQQNPAVVLTGVDAGHYVRYHTNCYVIANNFRITPQHEERIAYLNYLFLMSPEELLVHAPEVRYVLVSLNGPYTKQDGVSKPSSMEVLRRLNPPLVTGILTAAPGTLPDRLRKIRELTRPDLPFPIAALYEVLPPEGAAAGSTAR